MNEDKPSAASGLVEMAVLGQMWHAYRPRLLAMLERRLDPALAARIGADEILQHTFFLARRKWPSCADEAKQNPYAWWYRIARDCLIEAWRRETRDRRDVRKDLPMPDGSSLQLGLGLIHTGTSPSEAVARNELCAKVRQCLAMLKPADREILWMRHNDQLSFAEAGAVLDLSENTATVRYARALRRMKEVWQRVFEK